LLLQAPRGCNRCRHLGREFFRAPSKASSTTRCVQRKLWSVFLSEMADANHPMPRELRQNVANIGLFVLNHTVSVMSDPRPRQLGSLININREMPQACSAAPKPPLQSENKSPAARRGAFSLSDGLV